MTETSGASPLTYYKALRPDGTDFATGTTRPVLGEWMPKIVGQLEVCSRGYHVADAPAETLVCHADVLLEWANS